MNVVSTFAGLGGSSFGYEQAGWNVVGAVEFQEDIADIYRINHSKTDCWTVNVRDITGQDLRARFGAFDVLDGSPPCQAFSNLATTGDRTSIKKHEDRSYQRSDDLVFDWLRLVEEARPTFAIMENVAVLASAKWQRYLLPLLHRLKQAGYQAEVQVLKAELLGNPSTRSRMIITAGLEQLPAYVWPIGKPVAASTVLTGEALVVRTGPERRYRRRSLNLTAPTVTSSGIGFGPRHQASIIDGSLTHDPDLGDRLVRPWQPEHARAGGHRPMRMLTVDEIRRLMSLPPMIWPTGLTHRRAWELIGNSVPPVLSRAVADRIAA